MTVTPIGVDHVALNVSDVPAAIDFYTNVLGLEIDTTRPDFGIAGAWLDAGGQQVHLIELPVPPKMGQHLALLYDDLDAVVAALRAKGVEVADPSVSGAEPAPDVRDGPVGKRRGVAPAASPVEAASAWAGREPYGLRSTMSTCLRPRRAPNLTTPSAVAKSVSSPPRPTFWPG